VTRLLASPFVSERAYRIKESATFEGVDPSNLERFHLKVQKDSVVVARNERQEHALEQLVIANVAERTSIDDASKAQAVRAVSGGVRTAEELDAGVDEPKADRTTEGVQTERSDQGEPAPRIPRPDAGRAGGARR
jgi:hypothetical protein